MALLLCLPFVTFTITPVRLVVESLSKESTLGEWVGPVNVMYPVKAQPGSYSTVAVQTTGVLSISWARTTSIVAADFTQTKYAATASLYVQSLQRKVPLSGKVLVWNAGSYPTTDLDFIEKPPMPNWRNGSMVVLRQGDMMTCDGRFGEMYLKGTLHKGSDVDADLLIIELTRKSLP